MRFSVLSLLVIFVTPTLQLAQDSLVTNMEYGIHIHYPGISISKETLNNANTLIDLNKHYKSSWVKEYQSVDITTTINGKSKTASSPTDQLSEEQKKNMALADVGTDIVVKARYLPDNTLSHNDVQEFDFKFSVNPHTPAVFKGGEQQLNQYLKTKAIDHIGDEIFVGYKLAAVKFTVNTDGEIVDAHKFWTSEDDTVDALLLETVCNMPQWAPARYDNGVRVNQDFVLTVGNMESCVVNLLNIDDSLIAHRQ